MGRTAWSPLVGWLGECIFNVEVVPSWYDMELDAVGRQFEPYLTSSCGFKTVRCGLKCRSLNNRDLKKLGEDYFKVRMQKSILCEVGLSLQNTE